MIEKRSNETTNTNIQSGSFLSDLNKTKKTTKRNEKKRRPFQFPNSNKFTVMSFQVLKIIIKYECILSYSLMLAL